MVEINNHDLKIGGGICKSRAQETMPQKPKPHPKPENTDPPSSALGF